MSLFSELQKKIVPFAEVENLRNRIRSQNQKIVFTNGCFDLLHLGHLRYLSEAKELGDLLWVGLNSDFSVQRLKGKSRPVKDEEERAVQLAALSFVDFVTIFSEDTPLALLEKLAPDLHTKGGDYDVESLPETQLVRKLGGQVKILPFVEGKSTTRLIEKIQAS